MITYKCLLLFLISFLIVLVLGHPLIKVLETINIKQMVRVDGPQEHRITKSNTPTIGGLIFLIPIFGLTIIMCLLKNNFRTLDLFIVVGTALVFFILGFLDDYLKVIKKHNKGISGWVKLFIQFLVSIVIFYFYKGSSQWIYLLWTFFVIAGASNSYNLTDGLDGLLGSVTLAGILGFLILLLQINKIELFYFLIIFAGALLGFLYFNKYPAKIFMGDTGSLSIGGIIGSLAIVTRTEWYLILFATIPILEAVSVILQVLSCQFSKRFLGVDKRIFKMAPLHHHFELCGWKETDIVKRFFLFQIFCVMLGILILYKD